MKIEEFDLDKAKKIIREWAENKPFISRVYFFGSRVTGFNKVTAEPVRPNSDLDVAMEISQLSENEDIFTSWISEVENWHAEILALLGFSEKEHLQLEWLGTPRIQQYVNDGSILVYFK